MRDSSNVVYRLAHAVREFRRGIIETPEKMEDVDENHKRARASVHIENVVASATIKQTIDLASVVMAFLNVEYKPEQFPGLVFRLKKPKTATLIFSSGKMVCTGAKSERQSRRAVRKIIQELKNNGILIIGRVSIQVQNIVASASLGSRIDLEKSAYSLGRTMYEPEQFPGLIFRMSSPKVVLLLFASGKLVCTGAKKEEEVYEAVIKLHKMLETDNLMVKSGIERQDVS